MDFRKSVFKRAGRIKPTKQKDADGNPKMVKVRGGWVYRLRYVNNDGKPCTQERGFFDRERDAEAAMKLALKELEATEGGSKEGERMTFNDLCDRCEKAFYKPALIVKGQKISGVKSLAPVLTQMKHLKAYFGPRLIASIKPQSLKDYRDSRMKLQPPKNPGDEPRQLSIATVHRELAVMRKMMKHAHAEEWISRDVFSKAKDLFNVSLEIPRNRILTADEEIRLLDACTGIYKKSFPRKRKGRVEQVNMEYKLDHRHLRTAIILAIDAGLRRGEIIKLAWRDIDFANGAINVISSNTKTEQRRVVPLSARAEAELKELKGLSPKRPFPISDMKKAFATIKELAKIDDLHFHDLRATAGDRMSKKYPLSTVAKILGHSRPETTFKFYIANELETVADVKQWLDSSEKSESSGYVN